MFEYFLGTVCGVHEMQRDKLQIKLVLFFLFFWHNLPRNIFRVFFPINQHETNSPLNKLQEQISHYLCPFVSFHVLQVDDGIDYISDFYVYYIDVFFANLISEM